MEPDSENLSHSNRLSNDNASSEIDWSEYPSNDSVSPALQNSSPASLSEQFGANSEEMAFVYSNFRSKDASIYSSSREMKSDFGQGMVS